VCNTIQVTAHRSPYEVAIGRRDAMISVRVCFLLFVSTMVLAQSTATNLQGTLQWMRDTSANHAYHFDDERPDNLFHETATLHWLFGNPGQCDIKAIVDDRRLFKDSVYEDETTLTFNLRDVDPKSVRVEHDVRRVGVGGATFGRTGWVFFASTNELPKIACETVVKTPPLGWGSTPFPTHGMRLECPAFYSGPPSSAYFQFETTHYAQRFAKALGHVVELCDGKSSLAAKFPKRRAQEKTVDGSAP
jgi:hypothetical protein